MLNVQFKEIFIFLTAYGIKPVLSGRASIALKIFYLVHANSGKKFFLLASTKFFTNCDYIKYEGTGKKPIKYPSAFHGHNSMHKSAVNKYHRSFTR
jgi:hypothetical protein